jgi:hypothetical protein
MEICPIEAAIEITIIEAEGETGITIMKIVPAAVTMTTENMTVTVVVTEAVPVEVVPETIIGATE